jgi:hypothetical protein
VKYNFKPGDRVMVYTQNTTGMPIMEGLAIIECRTPIPHKYRVNYSTRCTVDRFVFGGECQTDPIGYLAKAQAGWRASQCY